MSWHLQSQTRTHVSLIGTGVWTATFPIILPQVPAAQKMMQMSRKPANPCLTIGIYPRHPTMRFRVNLAAAATLSRPLFLSRWHLQHHLTATEDTLTSPALCLTL